MPSAHDLRRTAATRLSAAGVPAEDVAAILNHARSDVTGKHYDRYQRAAEKQRALDRWALILTGSSSQNPRTSSRCAGDCFMVTKRTGRPPGRPRTRPPRRPKVGRPPQDFRQDPDRHAVALLDAMLARRMGSRLDCACAVAVWLVGLEGDAPHESAEHPGLMVTNWWANRTRSGAVAATVKGKALTLLKKERRRSGPFERNWREMMAQAFDMVMHARDRESAAKRMLVVFHMAAAVGEGEFAMRIMLPMMAAKFAIISAPHTCNR